LPGGFSYQPGSSSYDSSCSRKPVLCTTCVWAALVYLRRFSPGRGLSLRAPILSLANRLSHLLTRAGRSSSLGQFLYRSVRWQPAGPFHSALFGFRTTHPTQKGLFLLGRKPNLRSRSTHTTCCTLITPSFAIKY
jgi:hypothetical protein